MAEKKDIIGNLCKIVEQVYSIPGDLFGKYNVKRGLRNVDGTGVLVGLTNIGDAHGYVINEGEKEPVDGVLRYRGIDVRDLVAGCFKDGRYGFEEVAYLLLFGSLPDKAQLDEFFEYISGLRELPNGFSDNMIFSAPSRDIMNKLARSVLASYSYDKDPDNTSLENVLRQSMELIARFPVMVAYAYQAKAHYIDKKSLVIHSPRADLATAENFLHMMRPDNCFTKLEAETLDLALIIHAEHGGGNNSTFATHVVSSSGTDTYSAISAAIGSLKGPKHGGANAKVMAMIEDFKQNVKNPTSEREVGEHIVKLLKKEGFDRAGLIYGMGHAVYTKSDPRAILLKEKAAKLASEKGMQEEFELYKTIEKLTPGLFAEVKKDSKIISANVDLYSGFVYKMMNIPPELYTPLFAISRVTGWCAHRIEEIVAGGRIIRPAYKSISKGGEYSPLDKRSRAGEN